MGKTKKSVKNSHSVLVNIISSPLLKVEKPKILKTNKNVKLTMKVSKGSILINDDVPVKNHYSSSDATCSSVKGPFPKIPYESRYHETKTLISGNIKGKRKKISGKSTKQPNKNNIKNAKTFEIKISNCTSASNKEENNLFIAENRLDCSTEPFNRTEQNICGLFDWPEVISSDRVINEKRFFKTNNERNTLKVSNNLTIYEGPTNVRTPKPVLTKRPIHMYELNCSQVLIVLQPGTSIYFVGILELELLRGCVEVLGCKLSEPNNLLLFSLQGSCHLFFKAEKYNINDLHLAETSDVFLDKLLLMGLTEDDKNTILKETETCSFLIAKRKNNHPSSLVWPVFFETHFSFSIFPSYSLLKLESRPYHNIERRIDCLFEDDSMDLGLKKYNQIPEWTTIENDLLNANIIKTLLCGGKSVGKSTFLRYITNKCLQKWSKVLILDFDIGQCEFTVGGCISATLVDEPLLGPNYSHLKEPLRCVFLGEVDVTKCPQTYIEGCKMLVDYARQEYNHVPWIINTMGFTRGFGVTLNCGIIRKVLPTHVVQIESKDKKLNFPASLCPQYVHSQNVDTFVMEFINSNYKLYVIPSASEANTVSNPKSRGISPAEARNLVMLSYFSEMLSPNKLSLTDVVPFMISFDNLELHTTGKDNLTKDEIALTMNGNLVALCELIHHSPFLNCHGFGIIRGIDTKARTMYLITPLAISSLKRINCLVKGNIALPESLYYNQGENIVGHVPYVAHTSGSSTSRFARREFRPQRDEKKNTS